MKRLVCLVIALMFILGSLPFACSQAGPTTTPPRTTTAAATTVPAASPTPTRTPTSAATQAPQYGGVLRWSHANTPSSLSPTITIKRPYHQAAYDTFLRLDEAGELQPFLATEWKFSSDYKSLTLTLRKGVKFHDGTDFNAAAAKWNIETRQALKLGDYEQVTSVDVVNDYAIRINLSKFNNSLLSSLWFIGGMMHSPTAYAKDGKDQSRWNPVGTGPFKFVNYLDSASVNYTRFDGYWQKGKPYLDGFREIMIADATTRELALRNGEIDAPVAMDSKALLKLAAEGWPLIRGPLHLYNTFYMDTANADSPFAKKKVREAVEYAIDRKAITKSLFLGLYEAIDQASPSDAYAYVPDLKGRSFDPAKARQLLTEAGYPNGFKTTILNRDVAKEELVAVQAFLKDVGITVTIDNTTPARFTAHVVEGWNNMMIYRHNYVTPDWLYGLYANTSATTIQNKSMLRPPGYQELLEKGLAATDTAATKAAAREIVKFISDEVVFIPLWGPEETLVYAKNYRNMEYYIPWGPNKFWGPADVWLSK